MGLAFSCICLDVAFGFLLPSCMLYYLVYGSRLEEHVVPLGIRVMSSEPVNVLFPRDLRSRQCVV